MNIRILPVTLLCTALVLGITSAVFCMAEQRFVRRAVRTQATLVSFSRSAQSSGRVPVVEFTAADGRAVKGYAQRMGSYGVKTGSQVEILYTCDRILGQDSYNIFIVRDAAAKPYRAYTVAGVILGLVALGLAIAGIMLWLR